MTTAIFVVLCVAAEGFLLYALVRFRSEYKKERAVREAASIALRRKMNREETAERASEFKVTPIAGSMASRRTKKQLSGWQKVS